MFVNKVFDFPFQIKLFHLITKYIEFYYNLKFHLNILNNATNIFGGKSSGRSVAQQDERIIPAKRTKQTGEAKRSRASGPAIRTKRAGEAKRSRASGQTNQTDRASGRSGASGRSQPNGQSERA